MDAELERRKEEFERLLQQTEPDPWEAPTVIQQPQQQAIAYPRPPVPASVGGIQQPKSLVPWILGGLAGMVALAVIAGMLMGNVGRSQTKPQAVAEQPQEQPDPLPTPTPEVSPMPEPEQEPTLSTGYPLAIARCNGVEADANLRSSPGGAIASILPFRSEFKILQQGEWSLIESADGKRGYINQCFITGAEPAIPRVSNPPAPIPAPSYQSI